MMKTVDISYGEYASKWCLTDFYPISEDRLRHALESGEDFDTGWFGCKKEIRYARYVREGDDFTVEVSSHMGYLYESDDLIYDALWDVIQSEYVLPCDAIKSEEELPEDILESIRDAAIDNQLDDYTTLSKTIPASTATFDEIVKITDDLENQTEESNKAMFKELCEIVSDHCAKRED